MDGSGYTVGAAAKLAGVSVRTLHHYDRVGLVVPRMRNGSGYRLYGAADLQRLRQALFYRALGFGLEEIAQLLASPCEDVGSHLRRQQGLLREQITRAQQMLAAVEKEMEARRMGIALTPEEQFEVFGTEFKPEWAEEAEQRWGDTQAWRESQRRVATYTKQDWLAIQAEAKAVTEDFAAAMSAGVPAGDAAAMELAERHRLHISRWFYDCQPSLHRGLAELYVTDERFAKNYEDVAPGLARYIHDAMLANAERG